MKGKHARVIVMWFSYKEAASKVEGQRVIIMCLRTVTLQPFYVIYCLMRFNNNAHLRHIFSFYIVILMPFF